MNAGNCCTKRFCFLVKAEKRARSEKRMIKEIEEKREAEEKEILKRIKKSQDERERQAKGTLIPLSFPPFKHKTKKI